MRLWVLIRALAPEMRRNPLQMLFPVTVVGTAVLMRLMRPPLEMASFSLVMGAYMVGWMSPAFALAEEQEKRTLFAPLLTPARLWEVVAARAILGAGAAALTLLACLLAWGQMPPDPGVFLAAMATALLFTVSGGTLTGLLCRNTASLGVWGAPVILVLLMATTMPWEQFLPAVWAWQVWLPTRPMAELFQAALTGREVPLLRDVWIMLAYTAPVLLLCARQMRRQGP